MAKDTTMFVAIPMDELLQLIENMIVNALERFIPKVSSPETDELLNISEACELLHVSKVTIHKWKKRKLIKSYRIGRKIYFKRHELLNSAH